MIVPFNKEEKSIKPTKKKSKGRWKLKLHPFLNPYAILCFKNWAYINEQIISNPDCDQGFWSDISHFKKISSVKQINNFYNFNLSPRIDTNMPLPYLIDRLNSKGDAKVKSLAQKLIRLNELLQQKKQELKNGNLGTLQNYLDYFEEQKVLLNYCSCDENGINIKNVAVSKTLLDFLGFQDNQAMILKCMKLDMIMIQTVDPRSYLDVLLAYLDSCINFYENFCSQEIEKNPFKGASIKRVSRLINSKNEYIFCNTTLYWPHPAVGCFIIEDQISKVNIDAPPKPLKLAWRTLEQMKEKQKLQMKKIGAYKQQQKTRAGFRYINGSETMNPSTLQKSITIQSKSDCMENQDEMVIQ